MKQCLTLTALFILTTFATSAQTNAIQFGVRAGIGSTILHKTLGQDILLKNPDRSIFAFSAGGFASFNIQNFSLQPGVFLQTKGGQTTETSYSGDIAFRSYGKWHLYYLQVPMNLVYHIPVKAGSFYFGGGPYIAAGVSGKFTPRTLDDYSIEGVYRDEYSIKATFGNDERSNFKSYDYGVNYVGGFQVKNGILLNLQYDMGLANVQPNGDIYSSSKSRSFNFSVGYLFN